MRSAGGPCSTGAGGSSPSRGPGGRVRRAGRRRLLPPRRRAATSASNASSSSSSAGRSRSRNAPRARESSLSSSGLEKSPSAQSLSSIRYRGDCPLADFQRSSSSSGGAAGCSPETTVGTSPVGGSVQCGRRTGPLASAGASGRRRDSGGGVAVLVRRAARLPRRVRGLDSESDSVSVSDSVRPCDDADHVGSPSSSKSVARSPQNSSESSTAR